MLKNKNLSFLYTVLLGISILFTFLFKIIDEVSVLDNLKFVLFFITFCTGCICLKSKKDKVIFKKEFILGLLVILIFLLLSIYYSCINNQKFQIRTIVELSYICIPIVTSFQAINILDKENINHFMKILLGLSICLYIIEIFLKHISFDDITKISFINSYSPFESYIFADFSLISFCYFCYYKKNDDLIFPISNKLCYYLSFIFSILTFKRILILFSIILFVLDKFNIFEKIIDKRIIVVICIVFFFCTIMYAWMLNDSSAELIYSFTGFDLDKFTVGRKWYLSLITNAGYLSSGYGSTTTALIKILGPAKYLEMDLVKIYLEVGIIGLGFFIYVYWNQIYNNLFSVLLMFFLFVNLLFSHSLTTFHVWVIILIVFYQIKKDHCGIREEDD